MFWLRAYPISKCNVYLMTYYVFKKMIIRSLECLFVLDTSYISMLLLHQILHMYLMIQTLFLCLTNTLYIKRCFNYFREMFFCLKCFFVRSICIIHKRTLWPWWSCRVLQIFFSLIRIYQMWGYILATTKICFRHNNSFYLCH